MSVPLALVELIQVLRSQLEKADTNNSDRLRKTAWDYVQALRTCVDSHAVINKPCVNLPVPRTPIRLKRLQDNGK